MFVAGNVLQGKIHFALLITENPITQKTLAHPLDAGFIIARLHGDQGK